MESQIISVAELKQVVEESLQSAQSRVEAAGQDVSNVEFFRLHCAQAQLRYLDEMNDEPLTFAELEAQEVAPHLLREFASSAIDGPEESEPNTTLMKAV